MDSDTIVAFFQLIFTIAGIVLLIIGGLQSIVGLVIAAVICFAIAGVWIFVFGSWEDFTEGLHDLLTSIF